MKKKNILITLLIIITFFTLCETTFAKTCIYKTKDSKSIVELHIREEKIDKVIVDGMETKPGRINFEGCPVGFYMTDYKSPECINEKSFVLEKINVNYVYEKSCMKIYYGTKKIDNDNKVSCGVITDIPKKIPELTSFAVTIVQVAVPVILIIMGTIDLFKGITAQKEDEIKKGQKIFVKRLIIGALIFFIIVIVKLLISLVADASSANIVECIDCFLSGVSKCY